MNTLAGIFMTIALTKFALSSLNKLSKVKNGSNGGSSMASPAIPEKEGRWTKNLLKRGGKNINWLEFSKFY